MWGLRNFFTARVFTSIDPLCQWRQFVRFCWRLHKEGVVSAARRGGGAKKRPARPRDGGRSRTHKCVLIGEISEAKCNTDEIKM